ncbi:MULTISPECIES: TonB-dependent receptor [unclassified Caulobacter]|uniref:TonB-dependent receptor n=1 Tax=unclassified Caulobacter TaxID=2648921 RepID=UPI0006F9A498|nr:MULTISPECIES: TonB-dependent receptor [unclassified Caulobacter]KQV58494.1 outer membrane receptor protein [Caulobacter sp. Root342]KQV68997.1 outer membrane receptor protein [Caulobacter sp. Root343]
MTNIRFLLLASTAAAVMAATSGAAAAQAQASDSAQLEEIIVTSTKRAERLQDVPVSVTAVTADVLERNNVRELGDLVKLSPGLVINYGSQPGNFSINMRGIGTFSNGIAVESDVAVVIDDVPVGFQAAAFKDLIDVERVEVLRGPQSTLFGKSAIAGVLNIATAAPTREFSGKGMLLVTDDGEKRIGFTASGPIKDDLLLRVTVAKSDYDGNVKNLTTGKNVNGSAGFTATAKLVWTPTENLTLSVAPRYNHNVSTCCTSPITELTPGLFYQGEPAFPASLTLRGITIDKNNHFVRANDRIGGGNSDVFGTTARIDYDFGDGSFLKGHTLSSITSHDRWKMVDFQDIDGTDQPFLLGFPVASPSGINSGAHIDGYFHADSWTQELRLVSPGQSRFRYVAGLWYAKNDLDRYLNRGPVLQLARYLAESTNENYSAFANATWDVTEKLSVTGGARINRQKISYHFDKTIFANTTLTSPTSHQLFSKADQDDAFTGKVGVQYKITPDIMTFGTFSTGYKGQAYDLVSTFSAAIAAQMPVKPETAKNYEIGFKSSLLDRRVYFNATVFRADYKGFQTSVTSFLPDGTFLTFLNSVGQLRTQGVELDAVARVTSNFRLNGAFAYTDATVIDFPNGPCNNAQPATADLPLQPAGYVGKPGECYRTPTTNGRVQNLAGKRLNNTPKFKFNIGGQYDIALPGMPFKGFVGATYRWQDDVNFSLSQDPRTIQKAYSVVDLKLGITDLKDRYKVSVFANNLFDKRYAQGIGNGTSGYSNPAIPTAQGRTWFPGRDAFRYFGARLDVNF